METVQTEQIVLVPVPRRALGAVYAALAQVLGDDSTLASTNIEAGQLISSPEPGTRKAKVEWWSDERLARLRGDLERFPGAAAVLSLTAAQPEKPVSIRDVERESKLTQRQVAAQLAAFTKYCKSTFGRAEWPFEAKWLSGDTRASYVMGAEIAERWQRLDKEVEITPKERM